MAAMCLGCPKNRGEAQCLEGEGEGESEPDHAESWDSGHMFLTFQREREE